MTESVITLMGTIGETNRYIRTLIRLRDRKLNEVETRMELKARNKTPLNEGQQKSFHEFTGIYAQEGGRLQKSLMGMENTMRGNLELHNENAEALLQSLTALHGHQKNAIHSLRRLIATSENTLSAL